ncbi:hypothetical protein IK110_02525 [Candidatus Saccharibacteria bacterium]|nr:hypothetical protein [Candidatus Saccharibacteria bacterium]
MKKASRSYSENFEFHDYKKEDRANWIGYFVSCIASLAIAQGLGILFEAVSESDGIIYWAINFGQIGFTIIGGICLVAAILSGMGVRNPSDIIDLLNTNREPH